MNEKNIDLLIKKLESLHNGEEALKALIDFGESAIEPLRKFLIEGKPVVTYQSRQLAVRALSALGAKEVLMEYLQLRREISDPAVQLSEEAVKITAARELVKWREPEVIELMMKLIKEHPQPGVIDTLGEFKVEEAIPYFIKALEDDICHRSAKEALRKAGVKAMNALIETAILSLPSQTQESSSSKQRRASALELLAELPIDNKIWNKLKKCLYEDEPSIVVATASIAARAGTRKDKNEVAKRLVNLIPSANGFLQTQIAYCLIELYDDISPFLKAEIKRRFNLQGQNKKIDESLQILLWVIRHKEPDYIKQIDKNITY
jgi:hypothetical protein